MENLYLIFPDDGELTSSETGMCYQYKIDHYCPGLISHDGLFSLVDVKQCVIEVLVEWQCWIELQIEEGVIEKDHFESVFVFDYSIGLLDKVRKS